jgi:hypothetical protein
MTVEKSTQWDRGEQLTAETSGEASISEDVLFFEEAIEPQESV